MELFKRLPPTPFTSRGWGMLVAALIALLLAQVMGRRDLLTLGLFLIAVPLFALAGVRFLKPRFTVYREFSPASVETSATSNVQLAISGPSGIAGRVVMEERLPARFGQPPAFSYPARHPTSAGVSRYEYRLRSARRGLFAIGPVTAEFSDPFGLCTLRHALNGPDTLTVMPSPVELAEAPLAGARGVDGVTPTRARANPSDDDVMTREYRHGDPMRRVHWAATARQGNLMVRQEESTTTPEATLIVDQRFSSFASGFSAVFGTGPVDADGSPPQLTSDAFEWTVTALVSVATHLIDRNFTVRLLDSYAEPGLRRSPSAPRPDDEEFDGAAGLHAILEGCAALELWEARPRRAGHHAADPSGHVAFDDKLLDKLAAHRHRGPLIALLGNLSVDEARTLAAATEFNANAFALLVTEHPDTAADAAETLRLAGWRAVVVHPDTALNEAWFSLGSPAAAAARAGGANGFSRHHGHRRIRPVREEMHE